MLLWFCKLIINPKIYHFNPKIISKMFISKCRISMKLYSKKKQLPALQNEKLFSMCFCRFSLYFQGMTFPSSSRKSSWWRNACTTILWPTLGATSGKSRLKILCLLYAQYFLLFPDSQKHYVRYEEFICYCENEPMPETHMSYLIT